MSELSFARCFRLRPGGVECDADGLRVGGVALLARDAKGGWTKRDESLLSRDLSKRYNLPLDIGGRRAAIDAVACALANGELARAQIAALLLQLPDPPELDAEPPNDLRRRRLARDLAICGLLKADPDWDAKHPRIGAPPNPGWFASTQSATEAGKPQATPSPVARAPSHGDETLAFAPPVAGVGSLLAEDLSVTALRGLATLAARFSAATILFDAVFVPSDNRLVEEGRIPGRPDVAYRWAHDESATALTLKVLIDGEWRTLAVGGAAPSGLVYDRNGQAVARIVSGTDQRQTLVATLGALDRAVADLRRKDGEPAAAPIADDSKPKLCPDPSPEPRTTDSANSIAYQEYVSGLPYPLAIWFGGVFFDGCDPSTGNLREAKANIDFLFDDADNLKWWVNPKKDPALQMKAQSDAAAAAGRQAVWHAQTEKGYRGLIKIEEREGFPNLSVEYDPN